MQPKCGYVVMMQIVFGSFDGTGSPSADFSITVELTLAHFTGWLKKLCISEIIC